jgi:hypothetical protein
MLLDHVRFLVYTNYRHALRKEVSHVDLQAREAGASAAPLKCQAPKSFLKAPPATGARHRLRFPVLSVLARKAGRLGMLHRTFQNFQNTYSVIFAQRLCHI